MNWFLRLFRKDKPAPKPRLTHATLMMALDVANSRVMRGEANANPAAILKQWGYDTSARKNSE